MEYRISLRSCYGEIKLEALLDVLGQACTCSYIDILSCSDILRTALLKHVHGMIEGSENSRYGKKYIEHVYVCNDIRSWGGGGGM